TATVAGSTERERGWGYRAAAGRGADRAIGAGEASENPGSPGRRRADSSAIGEARTPRGADLQPPWGRRGRGWGGLPVGMGERFVRLSHAVDVILALERVALLLLGIEQLVRETLRHRLLATLAGVADQPPNGERASTTLRYLDGNLVGGATDAAGTNL